MKILYTIGRYWPTVGGGEFLTREIVSRIATRHRAVVACIRNDNDTNWLRGMTLDLPPRQAPYVDRGASVRPIRLGYFQRRALRPFVEDYYSSEERREECNREIAARYLQALKRIRGKFDLVHNVLIGHEFLSLASLLYARERGIPFTFTPISHPDGWRGETFSRIYRESDALFAMTECEKRFLVSQGARPERVVVVGAGPRLEVSRPTGDVRRKYGIRGPVVLFLGQKYCYKGVEQILGATGLVWETHPEAHFVLAGPRTDHSRELMRAVNDQRVIELGKVSDAEKADLLAGCDIFCMPSVCESFGMVYLEAWMFGKPVIAADTPTSRCFIDDGRDGLLVPQEPGAIADAICRMLNDPARRREMGMRGKVKAATRYTWDNVVKTTEEVYLRVAGDVYPAPTKRCNP